MLVQSKQSASPCKESGRSRPSASHPLTIHLSGEHRIYVEDAGYSKSVASNSTASIVQQDYDIHPVTKIVLSVISVAFIAVIAMTAYLCGMPYIYHIMMTSTSGDAILDLVLPVVICVVMPAMAVAALMTWMYTKTKNHDKEKVEYHDWKW